jgi:kynurenine aminotransferase
MKKENTFRDWKEPNITLWNDLTQEVLWNLDYSPWGLSTEPIPKFHLENIKEVVETVKYIEYQYYDVTRGKEQLLNSISQNFSHIFYGVPKSQNSRRIPLNQILVTAGALLATKAIITLLIKDQDDEIVTFEPYYPYYTHQNLYCTSGKFLTVPLGYDEESKKIKFNIEKLEQTLSHKTKLLILINPNNPCTNIFTEEEYLKISNIIKKFPDLLVLEDAAYFPYVLDDKKVRFFSQISEQNFNRTLSVFSGGKIFNVTGLRVGWVIGNEKLIKQLGEEVLQDLSLTPSFEQLVIAKDLESANKEKFYDQIKKNTEKSYEVFSSFLKKYKMTIVKPDGTYYCLVDVSCYRDNIPNKYFYNLKGIYVPYLDQAFCRMLLEYKIGFMPLTPTQNSPQKVDFLCRVSINRKEEDLRLVENALDQMQDKFGWICQDKMKT